MIKPLDEIHLNLRNNPLYHNTMFYKHIISLLFLIITANSFKLDETTEDTLGQFSKSEDDEDIILQDKDDWKEISSEMSGELDEDTGDILEQLSESEEDGDGFLQDKDDRKDISSEISEELDENLEELMEEKLLEEGVDNNEVMKMANFAAKMSHRNTLTVTNGGSFGYWGRPQFCSNGAYAVGYNLKLESRQGSGDDTALNGIKLYCEYPDGRPDRKITSKEGPWGDWHGGKSCSRRHFLTRFQLQVERFQGIWWWQDDTSATFAKFKCRDLGGYSTEYQLALPPGVGYWGSYGGWSRSCPNGQAICGLVTKVEDSCGRSCDDTTVNDVQFYCCD